ncbi:RNA polymerase-binding protein DksA [uncultured Abyssibacter sp.]|uniref:RNA polymerase-binding protein DksA n=1 Tax=uncultured Abyssibacter sp. TaxID=2320202 RepID=UPI0032B1FD5F
MSEDEYMNEAQLAFFKQRLLEQRGEVLAREREIRERLNHRESAADPVDRAATEEERWLDLRLRDRESKLLRKIESALESIRNKEYGYCEQTGEPIGIPRLLARPTATLCIDAKDTSEQIQAQYRD